MLANKIEMFHYSFKAGHAATDYDRFFSQSPEDLSFYRVTQYNHGYEPYVVYKREGSPSYVDLILDHPISSLLPRSPCNNHSSIICYFGIGVIDVTSGLSDTEQTRRPVSLNCTFREFRSTSFPSISSFIRAMPMLRRYARRRGSTTGSSTPISVRNCAFATSIRCWTGLALIHLELL